MKPPGAVLAWLAALTAAGAVLAVGAALGFAAFVSPPQAARGLATFTRPVLPNCGEVFYCMNATDPNPSYVRY